MSYLDEGARFRVQCKGCGYYAMRSLTLKGALENAVNAGFVQEGGAFYCDPCRAVREIRVFRRINQPEIRPKPPFVEVSPGVKRLNQL